MKASFITAYGGLDVIQFGELPDPAQGDAQIIVQIKAVSLNPIDYKIRDGNMKFVSGFKFPKILGGDFAGTVLDAGKSGGSFKNGDRVYGYIMPLFGNSGVLSEKIAVKSGQIRPIPENLSFEEAASLPVAALTALNGLRKFGNIQGRKILINGVTGGVGHFALQAAKAKGASVTGTCSTPNMELARKLGADDIIDYKKEDLSKTDKRFDFVFDAFGQMKKEELFNVLNRNGISCTTLFFPTTMIFSLYAKIFQGISVTAANMRGKPEDWKEMEELLIKGQMKPLIENTFPLERTKDAFDLMENGKPRGKIIIKVS
ncbi:MAG TPA: NADP-dependent oxidoreductase [Leptospiraceae bacterium]|nr:NADP-dependent oxidoreductase [Leptospiraceae bacterium]